MKNFEKATRPDPESDEADESRLLLVDNYGAHLSIRLLDYAIARCIEMIGYVPHSTHVLQGLDVTCFGTFQMLYGNAQRTYERETGLGLTKESFLQLVKDPFERAFSSASVRAAFRLTGVEPLTPQ